MKAGEIPMINVADRKWNDDDIAATVDLELPTEVSREEKIQNNSIHKRFYRNHMMDKHSVFAPSLQHS
jgi:hypothetical protein